MITPNGDDKVDAWTGMPLGFEEKTEPLALALPAKRTQNKLDLQGFFWKYLASGSSTTAQDVLACLATDETVQIRRRVAENPHTPADALSLLSEDADASVRAGVARNRHTPLFVLRKLSQDDDVSVRFAIAANPEMPDAILLSLFLDPDPYVAERASQTMAA
jgi:hypothetical protein